MTVTVTVTHDDDDDDGDLLNVRFRHVIRRILATAVLIDIATTAALMSCTTLAYNDCTKNLGTKSY